jgi:amino acid permease
MYGTTGYYPNIAVKKNNLDGFSAKSEKSERIKVIPADELPRNNGYKKTALLLVLGNLGTGVLTLPYAFSLIGLIPGVITSMIMAVAVRYTGVLLVSIFVEHQNSHTMGALAERLGGRLYARFVYSAVYFYMFMILSYQLLTASLALQDIENMCIYTAALYTGVLLLPLMQLRTLGWISYLGVLSFLTIAVVIAISLQQAGEYYTHDTSSFFPTVSVDNLFASVGTIGYPYCGQYS